MRIEARRDGDHLELRVRDAGPGVPADDAERAFERFAMLGEAPVRRGSHGLGLAFCRIATEAHGGNIRVEPRTPRGASFGVRIPQPDGTTV